jgi:hypothetical protein
MLGLADDTFCTHFIENYGVNLLESNALPGKGSSMSSDLILPYLEHNAYCHKIVYRYSHLASRWFSRWDTTDAAVESVHSGEFPLHYNVDSFCASEIVT